MKMRTLVNEFIYDCEVRKLTKRTIKGYRNNMFYYCKFLDKTGISEVEQVNHQQIHGTLSQSFNTPLGKMVGATPDGRYAYAPLSDAMSPAQGADKKSQ